MRRGIGSLIRALGILAASALPADAAAKEVLLFEGGTPRYRGLDQVEVGDVLVFSDRRFTVKEVLKRGATTQIYDIGDGKALRVPLRPEETRFVAKTLEGYRELSAGPLPIARVHPELSSPLNEYAVVDRYRVECTLDEFVRAQDSYGAAERRKMVLGLMDFARKVAHYRKVGDLKCEQLAWTGKSWVLLDWIANSELVSGPKDPSALDKILVGVRQLDPEDRLGLPKLLKRVNEEARQDIFRGKARAGAPGCEAGNLAGALERLRAE